MPTTLASLPMYDADRPAVERLWRATAGGLCRDGMPHVPEALCWPGDALDEHWLHPGLLLSQTCGYPIVDHLPGRVQLVGTFRYGARRAARASATAAGSSFARTTRPATSPTSEAAPRPTTPPTRSQPTTRCSRSSRRRPRAAASSAAVVSGAHARSIKLVRAARPTTSPPSSASATPASPACGPSRSPVRASSAAPAPRPGCRSSPPRPRRRNPWPRCAACSLRFRRRGALRAVLFLEGFEVVPPAAYEFVAELRRNAVALGCEAL